MTRDDLGRIAFDAWMKSIGWDGSQWGDSPKGCSHWITAAQAVADAIRRGITIVVCSEYTSITSVQFVIHVFDDRTRAEKFAGEQNGVIVGVIAEHVSKVIRDIDNARGGKP